MTPKEQRIALAEWAGEETNAVCPNHGAISDDRLGDGMSCPWCGSYCDRECGDYLNDLNAVHELEGKLRESSHAWTKYGEQLQEVVNHYPVGVVPDYHRDLRNLASVAHATAAQRCEAILKTLNLWKP